MSWMTNVLVGWQNKVDDRLLSSTTKEPKVYSHISQVYEDLIRFRPVDTCLLPKDYLHPHKKQDRRDIKTNFYIDLNQNGKYPLPIEQEKNFVFLYGKNPEDDRGYRSTKTCLNDYLSWRMDFPLSSIDKVLKAYVSLNRFMIKVFEDLINTQDPQEFIIPYDVIKRSHQNNLDPYYSKDWPDIYELTMFDIELENWVYLYTDGITRVRRIPYGILLRYLSDLFVIDQMGNKTCYSPITGEYISVIRGSVKMTKDYLIP